MRYPCVTFCVFIMSLCWEKGFSLKSPSSILVVGPTSCGKTIYQTFVTRKLRPPRIRYCYGSWQDKLDSMQKHSI